MPKDNDVPSAGLDADAMQAIRAMLSDEPPIAPLTSRKSRVAEGAGQRVRKPAAPDAGLHASKSAPMEEIATPSRAQAAQHHENFATDKPLSMIDGLKARVLNYRPSKKHIIIAAAVLLVLLRPGLVIGLLFLSIFVAVGVFLILGYDGFWQQAMKVSRWYATRRPDRAAAMHSKIDRFAVKWDAVLDRFPEGTVDGLYLPDFGDMAEADSRHDAAVDRRLDRLQGQ